MLKPKLIQKPTTLKLYNTLALPIILYGSVIWTTREKNTCKKMAMYVNEILDKDSRKLYIRS